LDGRSLQGDLYTLIFNAKPERAGEVEDVWLMASYEFPWRFLGLHLVLLESDLDEQVKAV
jgi:hypothetical protein